MLKYPATKGGYIFNHYKAPSLKTAELYMHLVMFIFMYVMPSYYKN